MSWMSKVTNPTDISLTHHLNFIPAVSQPPKHALPKARTQQQAMPASTLITEQDLLYLTGLSEDNLLWLIQALFSGTLWMLGEFMDDPSYIEEGDAHEIMEGMAYGG
ncbi:hypothetical protein CBER1_03622 [Cercospora berteroae]|uniref:Uncharacterized protein n=1 Tax=Cercospora berteroae TaxID=357750 RepID=A0A2S6CLK3_9PEZI|nr:hypothetical protein CBER1_03622 [Cercospora berteroae]